MEWQLNDAGTWDEVDEAAEIATLLASMRDLTTETRQLIASAKLLCSRARVTLHHRRALRAWPLRSLTIQ